MPMMLYLSKANRKERRAFEMQHMVMVALPVLLNTLPNADAVRLEIANLC